MFDPATAELLRSAPRVPGLDPNEIPALLTEHFADLVSARLRGVQGERIFEGREVWSPDRLADTYELLTSIYESGQMRRASAFVAGTAQQIIARRQELLPAVEGARPNIDRDRVDPNLAAAVLFLAAEQYADANEAASQIRPDREGQTYEATILSEHIADLARGDLGRIVERGSRWRGAHGVRGLEEQALASILEVLIAGIEMLAARFLAVDIPQAYSSRFDSPRHAFMRVLAVSAFKDLERANYLGPNVVLAYPGPHHLAGLLIAAYDGIEAAALTTLPPPMGADAEFWHRWLALRASHFPFVWPNHREAISKKFHETGKSAVVILPTGAGKTTISSLKIAGALAHGKKVVFLAPTHALVEQLTDDLQQMFPKDILGSAVSSDFDLLFQTGTQLRDIEVMTPERCLAMLSFAPAAFADVGLLVFDECHLLSPQAGRIRRAVDGMLCLLAFNHIVPASDLLFMSAMLKNGEDFAQWVGHLTGRECICVDLLWKPSRQARGVVLYKRQDLDNAIQDALSSQAAADKQKGAAAKGLRTVAEQKLVVAPWAIWGLQHNWLSEEQAHCVMNQVLDDSVALSGELRRARILLKPNANHVAARLALAAARNGLKAIVFVITKHDAISVSRQISNELGATVAATPPEQNLWDALRDELGDLKHALIPQGAIAVPHNSAMLRLERELAERMFRRSNGAQVIVATPTLAQGLNLPAHLAILAGDKRADADQGGREDLEAHEILNAAARAGRAGHLANGVVLLVPEPIISFTDGKPLEWDVVKKLKSVLPEDDRCVEVTDPLEVVLDRLMQGRAADTEVSYLVNRMAALREAEDLADPTMLFDLRKSFGGFMAAKRQTLADFEAKIATLKRAIKDDGPGEVDNTVAVLASQSGISMGVLSRLRQKIQDGVGFLPENVADWLVWVIQWLSEDDEARASLLRDVARSALGAIGARRDGDLGGAELAMILPGLLAWTKGAPISKIEEALGGEPDSNSLTKRVCPRARELVGNVIPRGLSFVMGLVSHVVQLVDPFAAQPNLRSAVIESLGTAVRKGFDSPELVYFGTKQPNVLSRVQIHRLYSNHAGA